MNLGQYPHILGHLVYRKEPRETMVKDSLEKQFEDKKADKDMRDRN